MPGTIRLGLLSTTAIVGFAAVVLFATHANAATAVDATWSGATDYGTSTNWTPNTVPDSGATATFDGAGSQIVDLGGASYAPGNVQVTGGNYTFQNGAFTDTTLSLGTGTITQFGVIGADRTATTLTSAGSFAVAHSGTVTLINTGTISTPTADVFNGTANLTLLNSGTISSGTNVAVNTSGGGTVTNAAGGVLQGGSHPGYGNGVNIYGTGMVDNYGSILGGATGDNAALQVGAGSTVNLRAGSTTTSVLLGDNSNLSLYAGTGTGWAAVIDPSGIVLQAAGTNAAAAVGSIAFGTGGTLNLRGAGDGSAANGAAGTINMSTVTGLTSLTKSDSGIWSLTGTSAPTGGTTLGGGVLNLGSAGALGTGGTLSFTGGTLQYSGVNTNDYSARFSNAASQAYKIDTNGQDVTYATGLTSSGGSLTKTGGGTLTLTGANTYSGDTTVSAGALQIGSGGTNGAIAGNVVLNSGELSFSRSDAVVFAGVISGSGAINQIGTGTTKLTGANTYTGDTRILAGTLQIGDGGTSGALGTGNVSNQGTLVFNRSDAITFAGVIGNTGYVRQIGAGTTTLTGENVYTGGTTISAGTLQIGNGGASGSITGDVVNNATLAFNRSDALVFSGGISGSGAVNQIGTGTTFLSGNNTYTGDTTVSNGTLVVWGGITSNVINAATFVNDDGTVTGTLTNLAGSATNVGFITGAVTVSGGSFDNYGNVAGTTSNNGGDATNYGILAAVTNTGGTFANTGTITGATTVSGGTFFNTGTINGGLTNSAAFYADGGSINGAIANNAGSFNVRGAVTSNNTFANASGATLAVAHTGSYTLQGLLTNAGALTIASGGQLDATAGGLTNTRTGTVTVAQGGTLRDDLNNAGTVSNNGTATANVATNTGTITNTSTGKWTGNVASSTGAIVNNGAWAGTINSSGNYSGTGRVSGLSLSGGVFTAGNGVVGSRTNVYGNLALASAVQYVVQVNPAKTSFTYVTGTAALGGAAVTANFTNGSYVARQYTILTADGGRTGTFGALTKNNLPANFTASLSYDANHAFLDLTLGFTTASGLNKEQQNVANTLTGYFNRAGGIPLAFGSLSAAGLSQVSGELGAGTQQATFDATGLFMGLMTDPSTAGRAGAAPQGAIGYADEARAPGDAFAAMSRKAPATQFEQRWNVWSAGFGGSQTTDGNAATGSSTASSRIYGGAVGADYRISPNTTAGFALAGGGTSFSVANSGSGRSDLFQAGGFVRHTVGATYLTAALAYGWQDVTTDRSVGADRLNARFSTNALSGRLEAGHRWIESVLGMGLTPYAAAQVTSVSLPGYAEKAVSTSTFGLNYAGKDATATRSEIGLRTDKAFAVSDGVMTLRSRAAWAHNFDTDRSIAATFQALPGASFVVNGAAQAREAALVTGSAEMAWLNGWTLAGTFEGEFSNVTRSYAGKGVVRYSW